MNSMAIFLHLPASCVILTALVSITHGFKYGLTTSTVDPLEELLKEMMRNKDERQNPCDRLWCYNGGTCESYDDMAWCSCMPGYQGSSCEQTSDSTTCYDLVCYNRGMCTRVLDIEFCTCINGYTGERCEGKNYGWGIPDIPDATPAYKPDLNVWKDISLDLPTDSPYPDRWEYADDSNYMDSASVGWIAPLTIVGIVILGALYGTMLHVVRHRQRRRLVLIRTVQVGVPESAAQPVPQRLMAGLTPVPYPCRSNTRLLRCVPHPGVTVPAEFESDHSQLLSNDPTSDNGETFMSSEDDSAHSGVMPVVVTSGAPPPYAEIAPADGGQSMDEPPPPYQDHVH